MLKVAVIGTFPFALSGGGPSARLRGLAQSLQLTGCEVHLFHSAPVSREFSWQGIAVREFGTNAGLSKAGDSVKRLPGIGYVVLRNMVEGRCNAGPVQAIASEVRSMAHRGSLDAVIFYNQDLLYSLLLSRMCRDSGVIYVQQYAEMHLAADFPTGWRNTFWLSERAHLHVMPRRCDGSVVISRRLETWVRRRANHEPLVIPTIAEIPPAVDAERQSSLRVLCMSNGARRDALPLLIHAMGELSNRRIDYRLNVVGLSKAALAALTAEVKRRGLEDHVVLSGCVPQEELLRLLSWSTVNVLLRTNDISSEACFPSRLYELFGSGAAVVLSSVGDLPYYFRDGQDCLLVRADDLESLVERMVWIHENPDDAAAIGKAGNACARSVFAPVALGQRLARYIDGLRRSR